MGYTEQVELILKLGHLIDQVEDETALSLGITTALVGALDADLAVLALPIGIGIATGYEISGNFGSPEHAEYSIIDMGLPWPHAWALPPKGTKSWWMNALSSSWAGA